MWRRGTVWFATIFLTCFVGFTDAGAVVVTTDLVTEGEPVPNAEITFETTAGEPVDLFVTETEEVPQEQASSVPPEVTTPSEAPPPKSVPEPAASGTPTGSEQPEAGQEVAVPAESGTASEPREETASGVTPPKKEVVTSVSTNADGQAEFEIDDRYLGQSLVLVIKKDGREIERRRVVISKGSLDLSVDVPAAILTGVPVQQSQASSYQEPDYGTETETARSSDSVSTEEFIESIPKARDPWVILEVGPYTNFVDFSPKVSGSTTFGTHDRDSVNETLTAIGVDASLIFPLSSITGFGTAPGTQLILGARGGGFTGDWTAHLDLDEFIQGADTRVNGQFNGYARILGGVRQTVWKGQSGRRVSLEVKGGGGIVDQEIRGTTKIAENVQPIPRDRIFFNQEFFNEVEVKEVHFKERGSRGFGFGEVGLHYTGPTIAGINFSTSFGIGLMGVEDSSFKVRTSSGDTRISIENDTDVYGYWSIALRYASDARLKRDVHHLATRSDGLRLYSFKYLWDDQVYVGVMAQDLLRNERWRSAVSTTANGYYAVDYGMLGLRMTTLDQWQLKGMPSLITRFPGSQSMMVSSEAVPISRGL